MGISGKEQSFGWHMGISHSVLIIRLLRGMTWSIWAFLCTQDGSGTHLLWLVGSCVCSYWKEPYCWLWHARIFHVESDVEGDEDMWLILPDICPLVSTSASLTYKGASRHGSVSGLLTSAWLVCPCCGCSFRWCFYICCGSSYASCVLIIAFLIYVLAWIL